MIRSATSAAAVTLLLLGAAACGGETTAQPDTPSTPTETPSEMPSDPGPEPVVAVAAEDYDASRFEDPTNIDHRWFPLEPGTYLEYRGSSLEDGERLRHSVEITVTDLTKVIDGVETVVVWERDYTEGELVEAELAMFAQDTDGNVWHLGQYPEEYEDGEIVETPTWIHGYEGATAGVTIHATPQLGTPDYAMGFAPPPLNWVDRGRVLKTGERVCVPANCYDNVVVIEEFETGLPDAYQDKFYGPGVGVVKVGWRGAKDESKEVLRLVEARTLSAPELAKARDAALKLEKSAYNISKDVYAKTEPAKVRGS